MLFKPRFSMLTLVSGLLCLPLLSSCGGGTIRPTADMRRVDLTTLALPPLDPLVASGQKVIRPDDKISITVAREPTLSLQAVRVSEDGTLDVPYIGPIRVSGRTTAQIAGEISTELRRSYLLDPRVSVNIEEYGSHVVTVEGSVGHPGVFPYGKDTTLMGALATAQGPTRIAKLNQIAVFRNVDGERTVAVFDLKKLRTGAQPDPLLEPGDRIIVGFSGLQQAWQDVLQALPLISIFRSF
jgi:polysaccharide export outer membrane protein